MLSIVAYLALRAITRPVAPAHPTLPAAGYRLTHTGWRLVALLPIPTFVWTRRDHPH
jgi:hypothetical protein